MRGGILGEFETAAALLGAVRELRARGYAELDAFTPYPVHGLDEELGLRRSWIGWLVFPISVAAPVIGYLIQWYCNAVSYPLNVGGRPPHAVPAFLPITFETMVLLTATSALLLFFILGKLPWLTNPMFDVEGFERATIDRYWIALNAKDPAFDELRAAHDFRAAGARRVALFGEARR